MYQQQVANYQNVILNANFEAENAMVGYLKSREQYKNLQNATDAARESARYIGDQAKQGFLGKGQTTSSQSSQLFNVNNFQVAQQDAAAQAEGNIALNLILLYRAMGGGWQIRYASDRAAVNPPPPIRPHLGAPVCQPAME